MKFHAKKTLSYKLSILTKTIQILKENELEKSEDYINITKIKSNSMTKKQASED